VQAKEESSHHNILQFEVLPSHIKKHKWRMIFCQGGSADNSSNTIAVSSAGTYYKYVCMVNQNHYLFLLTHVICYQNTSCTCIQPAPVFVTGFLSGIGVFESSTGFSQLITGFFQTSTVQVKK
jgi:hypothetical protein